MDNGVFTSYPIARSTWDDTELKAIADVVASGQLTMGPRVREFEQEFARTIGSRYAVMVNSGSSGNLLAVAALCYRRTGALAAGDQVIVPAVSWGTTFYPVHQYGLELWFVDVEPASFNIDPDKVEAAITPRTRAVFATNLLGAPCDFDRLEAICETHGLVLIEDSCEALGAQRGGKAVGTFGRCGTFSTYFSHHISTIEGGIIVTDDEECYQTLTVLRAHGWNRDLPPDNLIGKKADDPFYSLFCFVLPGYNLRSTEISAALGLCQLEKLDTFLEARRANAELYTELFGSLSEVSIQRPSGTSAWFSLPLVLEGGLAGRRHDVVQHLRENGVETRPVVGGNFVRQPAVKHLRHSVAGPLPVADKLDRDGFLVGNHHCDISRELHHVRELMGDLIARADDEQLDGR